jgi:hypothetical protein
MKKHRWMKPGRRVIGGGRRCIDCGLQRRIKPNTRTAWQWRLKPGEPWLSAAPFCYWPHKRIRLEVG